jgi:hypothetical protein
MTTISMNEKYEFVRNFLTSNGFVPVENEINDNTINDIYDIFNGTIIEKDHLIRYIAIYFKCIHKIEESKKYYLLAIEKWDSNAMNGYGVLLMEKENKIEEAKKYYLLAIEKGNPNAIHNYARLMVKENNMEEAKKYIMMSIENKYNTPYSLLRYVVDREADITEQLILYGKVYTVKENKEILNDMTDIAQRIHPMLLYKHLSNERKLEDDVEQLSNYRTAVRELGPLNAITIGYLASKSEQSM